jgi:hypothetical protein
MTNSQPQQKVWTFGKSICKVLVWELFWDMTCLPEDLEESRTRNITTEFTGTIDGPLLP